MGAAVPRVVRRVIPQQLQLVRKIRGEASVTMLDPCRFVPMIGEAAYGVQED